MALKKICRCGKVIDYGQRYCNECMQRNDRLNKQRHQEYNAKRADDIYIDFYNSGAWKAVRENVRQRDKGLCRSCLAKGTITYMSTVHHIEELKDCWYKRLTPSNLICLCERCHQSIHKVYRQGNKAEEQDRLRKIIL